jgi:tetratricopeptide (TPR) repeat protein
MIVLSYQQENWCVYSARGNTLNQLHRYHEAIESYDHAIALNPDSYDYGLRIVTCLETWWNIHDMS